jgi:hypothetical protein
MRGGSHGEGRGGDGVLLLWCLREGERRRGGGAQLWLCVRERKGEDLVVVCCMGACN